MRGRRAAFLLSVLVGAAVAVPAGSAHALAAGPPPDGDTPAIVAADDSASVELGTKFRSSVDAAVTGVSFYKSADNTGMHTGTLWSASGARLASVTFADETASGWQTASFDVPVEIAADTTYVVSYHAPNGRYSADLQYFADAPATDGPVTALQAGTDGPNGVFRYDDSVVFPDESWSSTYYWVRPVVDDTGGRTDTVPPAVTGTVPAPGATGVAVGTAVTAVMSEALDPASVTGQALTLRDGAGTVVAGSVSYDGGTRSVTFTPSSPLAGGEAYTASLAGSVTDVAGNAVGDRYEWGFTTAEGTAPPDGEQSLWAPDRPPASTATDDPAAVELGTVFSSGVAGSVTALMFYKSHDDADSHTLRLWDGAGNEIAGATTADESADGWQVATLGTPVAIEADTAYTVSYTAPSGLYSYTTGYLPSGFHNGGDLSVPAAGGVYTYAPGRHPASSWEDSTYWVDVRFVAGTAPADTAPPTVTSVSPPDGSTGVGTGSAVVATFDEPLDPATVDGSVTVDGGDGAVPGATAYDAAGRSVTFTPDAALAAGTAYTVTVGTRVTDAAGNALVEPRSWSFTTAEPTPADDDLAAGPGGPILVLASATNPFSSYYAEILRAEGLNTFDTRDVGEVDAGTLDGYRVVVLGDIALSDAQVAMLTSWVEAGGDLVAMHPDGRLADLAGLVDEGGSLTDGYLGIDTSQPPGRGITGETMQFHGSADTYRAADGTRVVATLYRDATSATGHPAVTMRSVGANGGQVVVFAYDLARSVVSTHQGNPAWSGDERDGSSPIRPNDLFFGAKAGDPQPDYVDLDKVAIPQADEQQRLLANVIEEVSRDEAPLPRFWYFPDGAKAVVVLASDDHATASGTEDFFRYLLDESPDGCSVDDWTCYRATSYVYASGPLTDAQAAAFDAQGFDLGVHVSTGCDDWSVDDLTAAFDADLAAFRAAYPSLPAQRGSRTHCIAWSDYTSTPTVESRLGIREDLNYYYWPGTWVQNRPGFMTGSGMNMRFADADGSMIDVFQLTTHLVNESGMDYPAAIGRQLDLALGPEGYYGVMGTHYDFSDDFGRQLVEAARSRGVPLVSVRQMLDWTDGRNASSFGTPSWDGTTLEFSAVADDATNGMLRGMLPLDSTNGRLTDLSLDGAAVPFTPEVVKGVEYAVFPAGTGTYAARYAPDTTAPTVGATTPGDGATGLPVTTAPTARFAESLDPATVTAATVVLAGPEGAPVDRTVAYDAASRTVTVTPTADLASATTYTVTVGTGVTDAAGNPLARPHAWTFTTGAARASLWFPADQAVSTATDDTASVELGVRFSSDVDGRVTGIAFYRSAADDAANHTVTLWDTSTGQALATATTQTETAAGWQLASFDTPVSISAGTPYTASYTAPAGRYGFTSGGLSGGFANGHLSVPADGGVFRYGTGMPAESHMGSNYWVDVELTW